jgi:hypothetical protein
VLAISFAATCAPAPLGGKACPCAPGYCCDPSGICVAHAGRCPCSSVALATPVITGAGRLSPPDGGPVDQLRFGAAPQEWVTYPFNGKQELPPQGELTHDSQGDGNGFHVTAPLSHQGVSGTLYVGFGLTFESPACVDGSAYSGVQFDVAGAMVGAGLSVGVTSAGAVTPDDDPVRGTCVETDPTTPTCFGPSKSIVVSSVVSQMRVSFAEMSSGKPLEKNRIVNVQWQVDDGSSIGDVAADFTIQNVTFY